MPLIVYLEKRVPRTSGRHNGGKSFIFVRSLYKSLLCVDGYFQIIQSLPIIYVTSRAITTVHKYTTL